MQLKKSIFLWVSLATLVPLTVLVLLATVYSQDLYQKEVASEVRSSLETVVSEIDRRLAFEREMLKALVDAPAIQQFMPVLESAQRGQINAQFYERSDVVNRFLVDFQEIVTSLHTLRILDRAGNTLIKVREGRSSDAVFDGIESFPYAEEELDDEDFINRLEELLPGEVGVAQLTQSRLEQDEESSLPMMDYIVPLTIGDDEVIGYLTANIRGEQIDRILGVAPRLHKGKLLIAEYNPDLEHRHGLMLYDDVTGLRFADLKLSNKHLQNMFEGQLWKSILGSTEGVIDVGPEDEKIYFLEYLPYPNLLASWVVATRIKQSEITEPFERIRLAIATLAIAALLVSVMLANLSAARIARPIIRLAESMKAYAKGKYQVRVTPQGSDETGQLAQAFNDMADTLDDARIERDRAQQMMLQNAKLASIGQLAAGIGHEINNPLGNILSYAKLLERSLKESEPRLVNDVDSLRQEALRVSQIIKGILNFARQVPPEITTFNILPWLNETVALVQQSARSKDITIECSGMEDFQLQADRAQLQQALVNLLLNAIYASPEGDKVNIKLHSTETSVSISIHDNGSGISEEDLLKIFDPFYSTKPVGEGTGLGLSICHGIIERHSGRLDVTNDPDGGVTASIILPRWQGDEQ